MPLRGLLVRADKGGLRDGVATFGDVVKALNAYDMGDPAIRGTADDGRLSGVEYDAYADNTDSVARAKALAKRSADNARQ